MDVAVVEVAVMYSPTIGPATESLAYGEVVPMPSRAFVSSHDKSPLAVPDTLVPLEA